MCIYGVTAVLIIPDFKVVTLVSSTDFLQMGNIYELELTFTNRGVCYDTLMGGRV